MMNMNDKTLILISAPILIAALCIRPAYALAADSESAYQEGLALYLKTDTMTAAARFKEAAEQGHTEAAFSLGVLYQNDKNAQGIPKDIKEAIKWYTKAADQNHKKAQFNLGHLFFEGIGIPRDLTLGFSWFKKAADQGDAKAQYKIGCAYLSGKGVVENHDSAIEWLSKAANQGDTDAIHTLKLAREMHAQKH